MDAAGKEARLSSGWRGGLNERAAEWLQSEVAGVCHTLSWKWGGGDFWAMLFLEEGSKGSFGRGRGTGFEDMETII